MPCLLSWKNSSQDVSLITLICSPGLDVRDTERSKVAQDGSITEAEFVTEAELNAKMLASVLCSQLLISSMLGSISLALALLFRSAQDCRALELMLVGHADALDALVALALNIRPLASQASTTSRSLNA